MLDLASRIPVPSPTRPVRVAVDGVDGSGKTTFAAELAHTLRSHGRPVVQVSVDSFHHPRAVRHRRGRESAEGFWLDSYDYAALRRAVLQPFAPSGSRRYRKGSHDLDTDQALDLPWHHAPVDAVLIVDGLFLHRDELVGEWDFSVFLDVPFTVSVARMAKRDGTHPDPDHPSVQRYVGGQLLYFAACSPRERASVVVDNTDLEAPRIGSARD
jgi:uridine kinase